MIEKFTMGMGNIFTHLKKEMLEKQISETS